MNFIKWKKTHVSATVIWMLTDSVWSWIPDINDTITLICCQKRFAASLIRLTYEWGQVLQSSTLQWAVLMQWCCCCCCCCCWWRAAAFMTALGPRTNHTVRPGATQRSADGKGSGPLSVHDSDKRICGISLRFKHRATQNPSLMRHIKDIKDNVLFSYRLRSFTLLLLLTFVINTL